MKLAFINNDGKIGGHLGHAKNITIYDFESDNFSNNLPEVTGGGSRARWMKDQGVSGVVIDSSGSNAINHILNMGLVIYDGRNMCIEEALEAYNNNELKEFNPNLAIQKLGK